ncbi:hypothetical protein OPKNFCMD_4517 [Methylobacterium crusticola]|uniref:Uncharacterized protein n=1 Tax=Methylobacterium crusticola TaxID=1697972 RepID=A0ABQ4R3M6_9HYPH|nr:hypothetical protein [Methylobacterium crusticola]GJD51759.1 hypothetical protein OPKNFCMD_4517 [Methylobacterium crusticola]
MALSGFHVCCALVNIQHGPGLMGAVQWGETLSSAGTTTNTAPNLNLSPTALNGGFLNFELRSSVDAFVAIGPTPNAGSGGARFYLPANETRNVFCGGGDRVAWIAA